MDPEPEPLLDCWEDADETQVERRACELMTRHRSGGGALVVQAADDPTRNQFAMAAAPSVTILRRPTAGGGARSANGDVKARPVRTLLQRQQDYEAARLRILGEAKSPDDAEEQTQNLQVKVDVNRLSSSNKAKEKPVIDQAAPNFIPNNVTSPPFKLVAQVPSNGITLLRTPRGPDNSRGFLNLRR